MLALLRPSDPYVCLFLSTHGDASSFERIAEHLGIGVATAHRAVRRLTDGGLIDRARRVRQSALLGVIIHGVRHVYYVAPGGPTRGVRTAEAATAPCLSDRTLGVDPRMARPGRRRTGVRR